MIRQVFRLGALVSALIIAAACGNKDVAPQNAANPDRFLFDRGEAALKEKKWIEAREFYRQVFDNYPQSPFRPDAKLGIADTYLGEKSAESLVLADSEYREFLTYYPRHARADYAQYKLAMTYFQQMRGPDRDQTATREALTEFQVFFDRFPDSNLLPEVKKNWRIARDRLSDSELHVGETYVRMGVVRGAVTRLLALLKEDPEYTHRDAAYYHLAEIYLKSDNKAQAIPYYQRLVDEFVQSEYLERAQKRLKELNAK
ncbi:MAG TPA: outer membrane protein assembly factor BamD [Vicinamibacterales bacterium]|jgi:outer membrane protein assembly factor BamD|nr:outer membrane protein assembly factor BamD [Vicinamibacterales bacterium]